jgi:hypothetical protein
MAIEAITKCKNRGNNVGIDKKLKFLYKNSHKFGFRESKVFDTKTKAVYRNRKNMRITNTVPPLVLCFR